MTSGSCAWVPAAIRKACENSTLSAAPSRRKSKLGYRATPDQRAARRRCSGASDEVEGADERTRGRAGHVVAGGRDAAPRGNSPPPRPPAPPHRPGGGRARGGGGGGGGGGGRRRPSGPP